MAACMKAVPPGMPSKRCFRGHRIRYPETGWHRSHRPLRAHGQGLVQRLHAGGGQSGALDAALVLRSIYQREGESWLQAGAGIVGQSRPARELEETNEKLACILKYVVLKPAAIGEPLEGVR